MVPVDENDIPDDAFSKDPIELTDQLVNKIDRCAEKQGEVFASKFKRYSVAVQNTDFSKTDPRSLYEVWDMITHLARTYGLEWFKADTCCDAWVCNKVYKFDQKHYVEYGSGFVIDYYKFSRSEFASVIPQLILKEYGSCSAEQLKAGIKDNIIDSIKNGLYW